MKNNYFSTLLMEWYQRHKRDLPWRNTTDPYKIWLSEIILQQTRVQQGLPYYKTFIEKFPGIELLAAASESEVLRTWQGLGYYSRARNMHAASKQIFTDFHGIFPSSHSLLLKLKGVGAYTAAAIASFAFHEKVAVVDGNVYRVLARVFGIFTDISSGQGSKEFSKLANSLLPDQDSSTYNQSIMEFGALHCTPAKPLCVACPISSICHAYQFNQQQMLPVKAKKLKKKFRYFHYLAISYKDKLLMKVRTSKDIWEGMYEPLLIEKSTLLELAPLLENENLPQLPIIRQSHQYKHLLTHQTIFSRFWHLQADNEETLNYLMARFDLQLYSLDEVKLLPKPVLIIKFLEQYVF